MVHLINGIRLFAVNNGITEPSTLGRLTLLEEMEVISSKMADLFRTAFETLMMFRILGNLKKIGQGQEPDNYLTPREMTKRELMLFTDALSTVAQMQKMVQSRFSSIWTELI